MLDLRPFIRRPISTATAIAIDPIGSWERFHEQYAASLEGGTPPETYALDENWEERLLKIIGDDLSEQTTIEFWTLWASVVKEMQSKGIQVGPESFKGWNDGDAAFVRTIWRLVRWLKPTNVVETGVAHGVTSRFILEALERNQAGHLWSIDRPPMEREWRRQVGVAVGPELKVRWTYLAGSSRRRLPALLSNLGQIDLFVHDSLHSARNVLFELEHAWPFLRPGGAIVVDDIDTNRGFQAFGELFQNHQCFVAESDPMRVDLRRFNEKGLFGIILKSPATERQKNISSW